MNMVGREYTNGRTNQELIGRIGFSSPVQVDRSKKRRVLITGAGSYIGESFRKYANLQYSENLNVEVIDMLDSSWKRVDFSRYDIVFHVAGIAHADVGNVSDEVKEKFYKVNTDLAVEVCSIAKSAGVKNFIFMSSMIIYGESAPIGKKKVIDQDTVPTPASFYGDSKLQADVAVRLMATSTFKVFVLRPPMIYGKGSKGNYPVLAKLAKKLPVFPNVKNERSMLHIDNLCEFLCQIMLIDSSDVSNVLIPQNSEWTKTCDMVQDISLAIGKRIVVTSILNPFVWIMSKIPGRISGLVNKAFGNNCYDQKLSDYRNMQYVKVGLSESIRRTEV